MRKLALILAFLLAAAPVFAGNHETDTPTITPTSTPTRTPTVTPTGSTQNDCCECPVACTAPDINGECPFYCTSVPVYGAVCAGFNCGTRTPTVTSTSTPTATPTSTPTSTAVNTATFTITSTPVDTATPVFTPTRTNTPTTSPTWNTPVAQVAAASGDVEYRFETGTLSGTGAALVVPAPQKIMAGSSGPPPDDFMAVVKELSINVAGATTVTLSSGGSQIMAPIVFGAAGTWVNSLVTGISGANEADITVAQSGSGNYTVSVVVVFRRLAPTPDS